MRQSNPDQITLAINIPGDIYERVLHFIKTRGLEETSGIEKIVTAGLFKIKTDSIREEIFSISSRIEKLRGEIERLIEENDKFEKLSTEYRKDNDYIYKRVEELRAENEKLEVRVRQQDSRE